MLKSTHKSLSLAWRCRVSSCKRPPHIVSNRPAHIHRYVYRERHTLRTIRVSIFGHFCAILRMSSITQHSPLLDIQLLVYTRRFYPSFNYIECFSVLPRRCQLVCIWFSPFWRSNLLLSYKVRSLHIPSMPPASSPLAGEVLWSISWHLISPISDICFSFLLWPHCVSPLIEFS